MLLDCNETERFIRILPLLILYICKLKKNKGHGGSQNVIFESYVLFL